MNIDADRAWIVRLSPPARPRRRLLCVPYAGGGVSVFARWPAALPPDIEVCVVQPPAREGRIRELPVSDPGVVVDAIVAGLDALPPLPLVVFAHSVGALVAFDVLRALRARGRGEPAHFIASAVDAPKRVSTAAPLHTLPDAEFVRGVHDTYGGIPQALLDDLALMAMFVPAVRADIRLLETYRYQEQPPLSCPITVFGGLEDTSTRADDLAAWADETTGSFALQMFPGGHFFMNTERAEVLRAIADIVGSST
jgi:medium-chain acyl-[acyl-carrier-protein] hydrolase